VQLEQAHSGSHFKKKIGVKQFIKRNIWPLSRHFVRKLQPFSKSTPPDASIIVYQEVQNKLMINCEFKNIKTK